MYLGFVIIAAVLTGAFSAWAATSPGSAPGMAEFDLARQTVQVVIALVITIGLLIITLWLFRKLLRMKRFPGIPGGAVSILEIRHVEPRKLVTLLKVLDRGLIVGWTEHGVTLLGELTPDEIAKIESAQTSEPVKFGDIFEKIRKKVTK